MKTLAVLPAWADSTTIPRKNLQKVAGLPLVSRAIRSTKAAGMVDRVIVLTDDQETEALAEAEGVEVASGPIGTDRSREGEDAAVRSLLKGLQRHGALPDVVTLIDCAAPFLCAADVEETARTLVEHAADSAFAAVPIRTRLWTRDAEGCFSRPSEAHPWPPFLEAGSVWAFRVPGFLAAGRRLFGKIALYPIDEARHLVIRAPGDLDRARRLAGEVAITLEEHPVIYVDIDETVAITPPDRDYQRAVPIPENIARINRLFDRGHTIVYWTARGGKSGVDYTELTRGQLERWGARYHRLVMGKPSYDLLICDKTACWVPHGE